MKHRRPSPYGVRARPAEPRASGTAAPAVLIVDDDRDFRGALAILLQNQGYVVEQATNGLEGLEKLRWGLRPRAILLDLQMRVMTGWEFCAELRRDPQLADIPIVAMTAGTWKDRDHDDFTHRIRKPIDWEELSSVLQRYAMVSATGVDALR